MNRFLAATVALTLVALPAQAQRETDSTAFRWTGTVPEGSWIRVRNLNGPIDVLPASGDQVEITANKTWRRGNPEDVRFDVQKDGSNVSVCALWFEAECDDSGYRSQRNRGERNRNSDVSVSFTVRLPRGVKLLVSTVNGSLDIQGARAEVEANTVNGSIEVATSVGPVSARTVNGSIMARMTTLASDRDMEFGTVNGDIEVEVPENFHADLEMSTVNGRLESDFPLSIQGRLNPRNIKARIGNGGRTIDFGTVNGNVELRKARLRELEPPASCHTRRDEDEARNVRLHDRRGGVREEVSSRGGAADLLRSAAAADDPEVADAGAP